MRMYCIYDRKGEIMNPPFQQVNNAMAIRQFQIMVNNAGTPDRPNIIHDYAEDFCLMYLGEFDEKTCAFSPQNPTLLLSTAEELLTPPPILLKFNHNKRLPIFKSCGIISNKASCISQRRKDVLAFG